MEIHGLSNFEIFNISFSIVHLGTTICDSFLKCSEFNNGL